MSSIAAAVGDTPKRSRHSTFGLRRMRDRGVCAVISLCSLIFALLFYFFTSEPSLFVNVRETSSADRPDHELGSIERTSVHETGDYGNVVELVQQFQNFKTALSEQAAEIRELKKLLAMESRVVNFSGRQYPKVKYRNLESRKRIIVTGGAGFLGSHLVDRLMLDGHQVVCLDNFFTGNKANIHHWIGHPNFEQVTQDIVNPIYLEADMIYHLASPASPPHYMYNPVKTIKTNTIGTINMLGLARRTKARILLASTSEVYGDPLQHPQHEDYWGNVNPVGPRSCYDEGKRIAEALMVAYSKQEGVDIRIARIFNTYGPRMSLDDGRVVSNFITQALRNQSITVYGNGNQSRSFQYVSDLLDGMIALMNSNVTTPVNFGNPVEITISDFAAAVQKATDCNCSIVNLPAAVDDPKRRRPDISRAWNLLRWKPRVSLNEGLKLTIDYFKSELEMDQRRSES